MKHYLPGVFNKTGIGIVLFWIVFSATGFGQTMPEAKSPDHEKRSCIQVVDGYSYLSENMTLAQTRAAAYANAKRLALENAKTFIQARTKVKDLEVEYDIVWSDAEGTVRILEQKDLGIVDNTRYHVWIKAEVEYTLKPAREHVVLEKSGNQSQGNRVSQEMPDENAPLTVKVWTARKTFKKGDAIEIFIQGNRDYYARIVDINSDGDIIQLLPNDYRQINLFKAGKTYKVPDKTDQFELIVSPPFGKDTIVVYSSQEPLGEIDTQNIGRGLRRFVGTRQDLSAKSRGIQVKASQRGPDQISEFYEADWTITTEK